MKVKICLLIVFLFSFCSSSFIKAESMSDSIIIDSLNYKVCDGLNFEERGVKVTYKSHLKKEDEIALVKKRIEKRSDQRVIINNDEINIGTSLGNVKVEFYDHDNITIVDLSIININKKVSISKLMKELTELQSKNVFNIRYFQYVKGKINNIKDTLEKIKCVPEIKNIDTLDIHNGYVGTANFNNGERVNIALNSYDTGNYLIIGTPVIFTTY